MQRKTQLQTLNIWQGEGTGWHLCPGRAAGQDQPPCLSTQGDPSGCGSGPGLQSTKQTKAGIFINPADCPCVISASLTSYTSLQPDIKFRTPLISKGSQTSFSSSAELLSAFGHIVHESFTFPFCFSVTTRYNFMASGFCLSTLLAAGQVDSSSYCL